MIAALAAGAAYFALVFAAGFGLGVLRILYLLPRLGETGAVLIELPVMLALCWIAARWAIRAFAVPPSLGARLAMGLLAFALLMAAEAGVTLLGFGRSLPQHLAHYRTLPGLLGFSAQAVFALIPALRLALDRPTRL